MSAGLAPPLVIESFSPEILVAAAVSGATRGLKQLAALGVSAASLSS